MSQPQPRKSVKPIYFALVLLLLVRVHDQIGRDQRRVEQSTQRQVQTSNLPTTKSTTGTGNSSNGNDETTDSNNSKNNSDDKSTGLLVEYGDSAYTTNDWDGAPVVIEEYKLIFFTTPKVGCTTWKQLFRRMMGHELWNQEEYEHLLPWNPELNGLKYLYDYDRQTASAMMTNPNWTRAIFVRDPKERFLSAYLDKVKATPNFLRDKCCPYTSSCVQQAEASLDGFLKVARVCSDRHWNPQHERMEEKYWPWINFVGRMDTLAADAERLLQRVGAWEKFGSNGWGASGNQAIFSTKPGDPGSLHATQAKDKLRLYFTPELEHDIDEFYASDYANSVLGLNRTLIYGS